MLVGFIYHLLTPDRQNHYYYWAISYWSRGICVNYETINQVSNFCLFAHNISDKYINYVLAGPGARCDEGAGQGCLSIRR